MQHNADRDSGAVVPHWLNDAFMLDIIQQARSDYSIGLCHNCKFHRFEPRANHSSVLFRTTVHFRSKRSPQEQAISLVVKIEPQSVLLKNRSLFETEVRLYREVLPAMGRVLADAGENLDTPSLFYFAGKPTGVIVLEDLFPGGWIGGGEIKRFEDLQPVIDSIAKFHAASFVLNKKSTSLSDISNVFMQNNVKGARDMFRQLFHSFADAVRNWEGFAQIGTKLQHLKPSFEDKLNQIYIPNRSGTDGPGYNVLNHGDFHAKNLLHKMKTSPGSTDRIERTALIDFQLCHWGTPAIDVLYLLDLVIDRELKHTHQEQIVRQYHRDFVDYVTRMGHLGWIPSLQDLLAELKRSAFLELFHIVIFEQFKYVDLSKVSVEDFVAGRAKNSGVNSEKFRSLARNELRDLQHRGILD
ncbi:uncharacterized protein LOC131432794 [Malaya genurostris]|uniref:uncharacterized protein LOC131432794 n=1 Tax=Malaya genurostris TaxID=325434 RepID=UPI0026F3A32C|nr:uncharacterized protein LOC131432794 [Malaya genurostris]